MALRDKIEIDLTTMKHDPVPGGVRYILLSYPANYLWWKYYLYRALFNGCPEGMDDVHRGVAAIALLASPVTLPLSLALRGFYLLVQNF